MLSKLQKSNLENRIIYSIHRSRIPDNIYPARGRKLQTWKELKTMTENHSRQYLPRKGTETLECRLLECRLLHYSRQYLPRKGTETASPNATRV